MRLEVVHVWKKGRAGGWWGVGKGCVCVGVNEWEHVFPTIFLMGFETRASAWPN